MSEAGDGAPGPGARGGASEARVAGLASDAALRALGVTRIPVPIPFPEAGGPVNAYLLEQEDGLLMFDSGLGSEPALAALAEGFADAGRRFEEVTRIVLSHGHVDHFGAAQAVVERAGHPVPVQVHPADVPKMCSSGLRFRELLPLYARFLLRLGVPAEVLSAMGQAVGSGMALARRVERVTPLTPGEVIRTRHLALEVVHMPGHTPGLCCLYDRERGLFFAADHLLQKVSPNPLIELGPDGEEGAFRPLVAYLRSVERLRALEVDTVLPGHGPPFGDHRAVIDGLLGFYGRRQARILEALAARPLTGWELTCALFPSPSPAAVFLVVSEAIGNVEVLEERGLVRREETGGVVRFARV